jgi:hypothetical protein
LAEQDLGQQVVLTPAAPVHSGVRCVHRPRPATPDWFLELTVDESLRRERVEVEAGGVGVDAQLLGELIDAERSVGGAEEFQQCLPARLVASGLACPGHGVSLPAPAVAAPQRGDGRV